MREPHTPTVLIADDEPLFVSSLARQVSRAGLSVICDTTSAQVHFPAVFVMTRWSRPCVSTKTLFVESENQFGPGPVVAALVFTDQL